MKRHITKKQWDELTPKMMVKFVGKFNPELIEIENYAENPEKIIDGYNYGRVHYKVEEEINIGQMIEFLGREIVSIETCRGIDRKDRWSVELRHDFGAVRVELTDALWEACKLKLEETNQVVKIPNDTFETPPHTTEIDELKERINEQQKNFEDYLKENKPLPFARLESRAGFAATIRMLNDLAEKIEEQQKQINFIMENAVSDSEGIYHCRLKDLYEETNNYE